MNGGGSPSFKENGNYHASYTINMAFKKLLNLSTPSEPFEAGTKEYVDNTATDVVDKAMKQRTHMIVVHSNYCGLLRKGEYQFVFGGNIMLPSGGECGFLMPHSGRIKKIKVKISHDEGIENIRNLNLIPWVDMTKPDPIFTFTLTKEQKNLTDFLSYDCFEFNNDVSNYYVELHDYEPNTVTEEDIRRINEERDKGITFSDKWGDKITLVDSLFIFHRIR